MVRRLLPCGLLLALTGCWPDSQPNNLVVQPGPFYPAPETPEIKMHYAPATEEAARRVNELGLKILAANPQIGMRPYILTVGTQEPEIFHRGQAQIIITEGLVKQCTTDRFLAAVLCLEFAKMVAEREALASVQARQPELEPPVEMRVGTDSGGTFGSPDATRLAELGRFERNRRAPTAPPPAPPDPQNLARTYLAKANFHAGDLDAVLPIVKKAQETFRLEKQMTGTPAAVELPKEKKKEPTSGE
jgi:hypothetical protein